MEKIFHFSLAIWKYGYNLYIIIATIMNLNVKSRLKMESEVKKVFTQSRIWFN